METAILVVHILAATGIISLVLIQHGKGADAGAAFGAGAAGGVSGSVFGAKGSGNFLSRSTALLATVFFLTSLSLAYLTKTADRGTSLMDRVEKTQAVESAPQKAESDVPVIPETDAPLASEPAQGAADAPKTP